MPSITVKIADSEHAALKAKAERSGKRASSLVAEMISSELAKWEAEDAMTEAYFRKLSSEKLAGKVNL